MPTVRPGAAATASTTATTGLTLRFRLKNIDTDETILGPTATGVAESSDTDGFYIAHFTAPDEAGAYARGWDVGSGTVWWDEEDLTVTAGPLTTDSTFATVEDIARRMGRALTDREEDQAELLIGLATGLIADALGRDADWAADLDPVPPRLRTTCIEAVVRVLLNPGAVRSFQEQLGQHSYSASYGGTVAGLEVTDAEARRCRRAVFGSGVASPSVGSVLTQLDPVPPVE